MQQYDLETAFRNNEHHVLNDYLHQASANPLQAAADFHELLKLPGTYDWLGKEFEDLDDDAYRVFVMNLYPVFRGKAWIDDMMIIWTLSLHSGLADPGVRRFLRADESDAMPAGDIDNDTEEARERRHLWFLLFFQYAEIGVLSHSDDAETYLKRARKIARIDFLRHPNRLAQSEEGAQLAYGTEAQDMILQTSWSSIVRIINVYLRGIAHDAGDEEEAQRCAAFIDKADRLFDPDGTEGQIPGMPGVRIIHVPLDDQSSSVRRPYKPDFRRNTAIRFARQACELHDAQRDEEAWDTFEKSNAILRQIYEDGETGELYDMNGVSENHAAAAEKIRTECLRDLGLNFKTMAACADHAKTPDDVRACVTNMVRYGEMFDKARNSAESKSDLEGHYAIALTYLMQYDRPEDRDTCLGYCEGFYRTREESYAKGTKMDRFLQSCWGNVNGFIQQGLAKGTIPPERVIDMLHESVMAAATLDDFVGYRSHVYFMDSLMDRMHERNEFWANGQTSLESMYVGHMGNVCGLLFRLREWEQLKNDANRLLKRLPMMRESQSAGTAATAVASYGIYLYESEHYEEAAKWFGDILDPIRSMDDFPRLTMLIILRRYMSSLLRADRIRQADQVAQVAEVLTGLIELKGYEEARRQNPTIASEGEFLSSVFEERCTIYLEHAMALGCMGDKQKMREYLFKLESGLDDWQDRLPADFVDHMRKQAQRLRSVA
ncbi:hypothetical protein [Bifidobacterium callimiconis]|uniref:Uncharacterized protein n=1 Tax=Bifidobacterium callimiconis TaxID=2306973 RepID=A0A430FEB1_9BIFI|nr:hypothetical protein [Bifidobacterium callimiconis]MBT1177274.1 hypothetical protein [Bifidobacterium callimiconis]RSX51176.1 hypothetical protein D2E23_1021 [Bifidobacterium callimiconis]